MRLRLARAVAYAVVTVAVIGAVTGCAGTDMLQPAVGALCTSAPVPVVSGAGVSLTESAGVSTWAVVPRGTDLCIGERPDSHFVYRAPTVVPNSRLFLFLPGTLASVRDSRLILAQAARSGYHTIGLAYPNTTELSSVCALSSSGCFGDTRLEILTGQAVSAVVEVDRANSIENRVLRLLQFMRHFDPGGNWEQFVVGDSAPAWEKVSVAGHEQGGGFALFIAHRRVVARASAYSSFGDALPNGALAPWLRQPFATPIARVFGVISTFDELVSPSEALAAWTAIGMGSALIDIDITAMPYGSAQRFITALSPFNAQTTRYPNHGVLTMDLNTPIRQGVPSFASVWRAVSFPQP